MEIFVIDNRNEEWGDFIHLEQDKSKIEKDPVTYHKVLVWMSGQEQGQIIKTQMLLREVIAHFIKRNG